MKKKVKRIDKTGKVVLEKAAKVKGNFTTYRKVTVDCPKVVDDPSLQLIMHENGTADKLAGNGSKDKQAPKRKRYG